MRLPSGRSPLHAAPVWAGLALTFLLPSLSAEAQVPRRRIAQMDVSILGLSATVEPSSPVVPKATPAGVQIVVRGGTGELSRADVERFFGADFRIQGDLTGPGLSQSIALPYTPAVHDDPSDPDDQLPVHPGELDPLILPLPGLPTSGDYTLANLRITAPGRPDFDVTPNRVTVKVIEQVLVTSVKTRALTLDEIRAKGIVLDSDDYYAFEFTLGLMFESKPINFTFPVAFDRQGVPIPDLITPPSAPSRHGTIVKLPTIVPVLFEMDQEGSDPGRKPLPPLPNGVGEVRIPSVIVIPGNIGYLKQFFSAKLYVANAAPVGSGLTVRDITGTLHLPVGPDGVKGYNSSTRENDDPLALPTLLREGVEIVQPEVMSVRAVGPDGEPATDDDVEMLAPGEQGEAEFLIRGEHEGFHTIDFDIRAELNGLVTGPVRIKGKASGAVLVRNPYFDVTFTVPGVVRDQEPFSVFVTLTNLGQGLAQGLNISLRQNAMSGALLVTPPEEMPRIDSLGPGESDSFELKFLSQKTGQVVASYLEFKTDSEHETPTGSIELSVGIGERGVPLSPDTLVLPAAVDELPSSVVRAAMRVLGQAWSIANAPGGTLPSNVRSISRNVVSQKALALAEAGLRVQFGQSTLDAVRDVAFDYWGGPSLDAGFDQLLRTTDAGRGLASAIGAALADIAGAPDPLAIENGLAQVAVSGADFASFAVASGDEVAVALVDGAGRRTWAGLAGSSAAVPGAVLLPLGDSLGTSLLGLLASATSGPYVLELSGASDATTAVSLTLPDGSGSFVRGEFASVSFGPSGIIRLSLDASQGQIALESDFGIERQGQTLVNPGPQLISATLVGPEVLQGAGPFGFNLVALFDRIVDATSAAAKDNYAIPKNGVQSAGRQLSGRMVFLSLDQPEGEYVRTTFALVGGVTDLRGVEAPAAEVEIVSLLVDPGAVVSGHVFEADGTPVTSGVVTYANNPDFRCVDPTLRGFAAVPLDGNGYYEFRNVVRDRCGSPFTIYIQDPATGGRRENRAFVRGAGEAITLDFALFGRGSVEGIVSDIHGPVAGATVVAISQTDPQIGGRAETDGAGHYRIDGITVGGIVVKAAKGMGVGAATGRIDATGTTAVVDVTLDSDAATVRGLVQKVEGGEYQGLVGVPVVFAMRKPNGNYQNLALVETAGDGTFVFEGVPAGSFVLKVVWDRFSKTTAEYSVPAHGSVSVPITIVVPPPAELATVQGQVYLPDGTEAHDVVVRIGDRGVVSEDGSYEITGIPVANRTETVLAQSRDGRRSGSTKVVVNEARDYTGYDITLSGLGSAAFRVLDEKGQAVVGQAVGLLGHCENLCGCAWAQTDADGIARFENLSYGGFTARAVRSTATFVDVAEGSARVVADGATVMTTMRFPGAGTVKGTVSRPDSGRLSEIPITLKANRFDTEYCTLVYGEAGKTWAGEDGSFSFLNVNLGPASVHATHPFLGSTANRGSLDEAGEALTLDLAYSDSMAGVLSGTVSLPDGTTAGKGIEVMVEGPLPEVKVTTLPEGTYEFAEILPEGYYTLTARDPVGGGLFRSSSLALKVKEDKTFDFRLKGRGHVTVLVVEGEDVPVENAIVRLAELKYPSRSFDQTVRPGTNGLVTFLDVYEGQFRVTVSDSYGRSGSVEDEMPPPGQEVTVKVKVTPTGRVTGHFYTPTADGGRVPVPYGTVELKASGRVVGRTTTLGGAASLDPGFFAFDYVPVGPISLEAQDPQTARIGARSATIDHEGEPPTVVDIVAQKLGTVHGTVTLNGAIQALARAQVSSGGYRAETMTNDDGEYAVSGVPEGRVTVTASLGGNHFLAGSHSDVLEGEGGDVQIDVTLRQAGSVGGRIVPASPADVEAGLYPPANVKLSVGGEGGGSQTTSTLPDGTFGFSLVPTGHVKFTADVIGSIDHGSAELEVVPGDNPVEIPLQGVGSLEGVAVASPDEGAPPVSGWIHFTGTSFPGNGEVRQVGSNGFFRLPEVLAGEFTAKLQHGNGVLALYGSASGTVRPGELTTIVVALQPSGEIRGTVYRQADTPEGRRPAFGAEVKIEHAKGAINLLAQEEGDFSIRGVPYGPFAVRVFDPISTGRAYVADLTLDEQGTCLNPDGTTQPNCVDVGEIMIDQQAPAMGFVSPPEGSTTASLSGPLVLEVTAETAADVVPSTIVITYPGRGKQTGLAYDATSRRFTGVLQGPFLDIGANLVLASVKDEAGNVGQAEVRWNVTGGAINGRVLGSDGQPRNGVTVRLGQASTITADNAGGEPGWYAFHGLRPGLVSIKATDPDTSLESVPTTYNLVDGETHTMPELRLPASARLHGVVLHTGGSPVGITEGTTVKWSNRTADTQEGGTFDLGMVEVAAGGTRFELTASTAAGDLGVGGVTLAPGSTTGAEISLNGVGTVTVTVTDALGALVPDATVTLSSNAPFPRSHKGTTNTEGTAVFERVLAGTITATASRVGLGGSMTGLLSDGGSLGIPVSLEPAGQITGTLSRGEGGAAIDVPITLSGCASSTVRSSDPDGAFFFGNVPFGVQCNLRAETADGDFGAPDETVKLSAEQPVAHVAFALNGLGEVDVLVQDTDHNPVVGASVSVSARGRTRPAQKTGSDGHVIVQKVVAGGQVTASATHPTNGTTGQQVSDVPLAPAGNLPLTITLPRLGAILGVVYDSKRVAVDGVEVRLNNGIPQLTHDGGQFEFRNLVPGSYALRAYLNGRLRAASGVITVDDSGRSVDQDLTLVAVAPVTGTVTLSTTAPAVGASVKVVSGTPSFGGEFSTTTDAEGHYSVSGVPIGEFEAKATLGPGSAVGGGVVTVADEPVTVNLKLIDNAVALPITLQDANELSYKVNSDGISTRGIAGLDPVVNSKTLTVLREGVSSVFSGPVCEVGVKCTPTEENGREIVLQQADLAGLEATRRVFVPKDGYFGRLVDTLRNPGPDPVMVSVVRDISIDGTVVFGTSSGDMEVDGLDRWVLIDDADVKDIYYTGYCDDCSTAPTAVVLSGPDASSSPVLEVSHPTEKSTRVRQTWQDVVIDPGETVAFLSLLSPQADRDRARSTAERLVQLPPEALVGLSPGEASAVRNFAVPSDLVSPVPALALDGVVTGSSLAWDGQTPASAGYFYLRSLVPYYGRPLGSGGGGTGFSFPSSTDLIPRGPFQVWATPSSPFSVPATSVTGSFPTEGTIDLTNVTGRTLAVSSAYSNRGPGQAVDGDFGTHWRSAAGDSASQGKEPFFELGLPGDATIHEVRIAAPGGDYYCERGIRTARLELFDAGGVEAIWSQDVEFWPPVDGRCGANVSVPMVGEVRRIRLTSLVDSLTSGYGPAIAEFRVFGEGSLGPAREARQDIIYAGTALLKACVVRSDAPTSPVVGATVSLDSGKGGAQTGADGCHQWPVLPSGTYTITAKHPAGSPSITDADIKLAANESVRRELRFAAFGSLEGTITKSGGGVLGGYQAQVSLVAEGFATRSTYVTAGGGYGFTDVPPGAYTLQAGDTRTNHVTSRPVSVEADKLTTADLELNPVAAVTIQARFGSETGPAVTGYAYANDGANGAWRLLGRSSDGQWANKSISGVTPNGDGTWNTVIMVQTTDAWASSGFATFVLSEGTPPNPAPIVVVPGLAPITGRLVARDGKAIAVQATVSVIDAQNPQTKISANTNATTGDFTLPDVPVGNHILRSEIREVLGGYWTHSNVQVPVVVPAHGEPVTVDALAGVGAVQGGARKEMWTRSATAGESIDVLVGGRAYADVPALSDPAVEVYGPDGSLVAENDDRSASDKNSEVAISNAVAGTYVIAVSGSHGATGGYRVASWLGLPFAPYEGPLFGGLVTRVEDGQPVGGQGIRLVRRGTTPSVLFSTATGQGGQFVIPALWSGGLAVEAVDVGGVVIARREFEAVAGEDPGGLDLTVRRHGTVTVHVVRGPVDVVDARVTVESEWSDVPLSDRTRTAVTGADGTTSLSMPVGAVTARALDPVDQQESVASDTLTAGGPLILTVDVGAKPTDVSGTVTGGSDESPVSGAIVTLVVEGTTVDYGTRVTDSLGRYEFKAVPPATYTLRAALGAVASETSVVLSGGELVRDLSLPVSVVKGYVKEADGSGARATVQLCNSGNTICASAESDRARDGAFIIAVPITLNAGASVKLTATPLEGCTATASKSFSLSTATTPRTYTHTLSFSGRGAIAGSIVGGVPPYQITLPARYCTPVGGEPFSSLTFSSANGQFLIQRVSAPGSMTIEVADAHGIPGWTTVSTVAGATTAGTVEIAATGALTLSLEEDGGPRGGQVTVVSPLTARERWSSPWSRTVDVPEPGADGESGATVVVPAGPFWVHYGSQDPYAAAEGELAPETTLAVPLQVGSHVAAPQALSGEAGTYEVAPESYLWASSSGGPTAFFPFTRASGYSSAAGSAEFRAPEDSLRADLLRGSEDGASLTSLMAVGEEVRARRRYFVPLNGEFARTATVVENRSSDSGEVKTVDVRTQATALGEYGEGVMVWTSDGDTELTGDDSYAVYRLPSGAAAVFVWGAGATASSFASWGGGCGGGSCYWVEASVEHEMEVPPGESRILLTFYAQGDWSDEEAIARAERLLDLSEPGALAGLTPEERAQIANLTVPPVSDVTGTVLREDGATAVAGAAVALVQDGATHARVAADAAGEFTLAGVLDGEYSIEAWDPTSGRPGRLDGLFVMAGAPTSAEVVLLPDSQLASLEAVVETELTRRPAPGVAVRLTSEDWTAWRVEKVTSLGTDGAARAMFGAVPPGLLTASVVQGASVGTASPAAGETAKVTLVAPEAVSLPYDLTGADGVPYWVAADGRLTGPNEECAPLCTKTSVYHEGYGLSDSFEYPVLSEGLLRTPREVVHGPHASAGIVITRRVFVPPSGRFARVLDILRNDGSSEEWYEADFRTDLMGQTAGAAWAVAATSSGDTEFDAGDDYVVVTAQDEGEVAIVTAGPGGTRPDYVYLEDGATPADVTAHSYYNEAIPPGETHILMSFYVLRPSGGSEGQALALATLADPEALTGLTLEERAQIVNFVLPTDRGDVRGTVKADGAPVLGAQVTLTGDGGIVGETVTDGLGRFSFTLVSPGIYTLGAIDPSSGRAASQAVEVVANAVSTVDFLLFAPGELGRVVVQAVCSKCAAGVDGGVSGVDVVASVEGSGWKLTLSATMQDGIATFEGVPPGTVTVSWPERFRVSEQTEALPEGGQIVMTFDVAPFGTLTGRVTAADGEMMIEGATVSISDAASGEVLATLGTSEDGSYVTADLYPPSGEVRIVAAYDDPPHHAETAQVAAFGVPGQGQTADLALPIAVISGSAHYAEDGEPVPRPEVFATLAAGEDPPTFYWVDSTDEGEFLVFVTATGDYVLTVQGPTGLTQETPISVSDLSVRLEVSVTMPPSAEVAVTVQDASGAPVAAQVALGGVALRADMFSWDQSVSHSFARLPLSDVTAYAKTETEARGSVTFSVGAGGATITLPATTTLTVSLVDWPAESTFVQVYSLDHDGPFGPFLGEQYVGSSGEFVMPVGRVRVGAVRYVEGASAEVGVTETVLEAGVAGSAEVQPGTGISLPWDLVGGDGFHYPVTCGGALESEVYLAAYRSAVAGRAPLGVWPCIAASELDGRQLVVGPYNPAGIETMRKVYVPPEGGFARFLDVLTNRGSSTVTVLSYVVVELASGEATRMPVPPSDTGWRYAVSEADGQPTLAHVYVGEGIPVPSAGNLFAWEDGWGTFDYEWEVTLEPGETKALMHFAVQRAAGDLAGAQEQAEALVNLTDPQALVGLTTEERDQIVNFYAQ